MSEPFYAEPIEAWRTWDVGHAFDQDGEAVLRLEAVSCHYIWPVSEPAECVCNAEWIGTTTHVPIIIPGLPPGSTYQVGANTWMVMADGTITRTVGSHRGPNRGCSCGFWAVKELNHVHYATGFHAVWGRVALWGKVIEHTDGYRAQYAYPVELFTAEPLLASELEAYGVPVHVSERPDVRPDRRSQPSQVLHPQTFAQMQQITNATNTSVFSSTLSSSSVTPGQPYYTNVSGVSTTPDPPQRRPWHLLQLVDRATDWAIDLKSPWGFLIFVFSFTFLVVAGLGGLAYGVIYAILALWAAIFG